MLAEARDWGAFDGFPLVDVIDQLYVERVEDEIRHSGNSNDPGMAAAIRRHFGRQWWSAYYPTVLVEHHTLPKMIDNHCFYFVDRLRMLEDCLTPLLAALYRGEVLVEANGGYKNNFKVVSPPAALWRDGYWILCRGPTPELIAVRSVSGSRGEKALEGIQEYRNPHLIVVRPGLVPVGASIAAPEAEDPIGLKVKPLAPLRSPAGATSELGRAGTRPDPRNKSAQMIKGLELALDVKTITPGMTLVALHRAMLDALGFPRGPVPRGFAYDAFRNHCRSWLVERNFVR